MLSVATSVAREENCTADELEIVQLAALLHDICDWKYSGSETAGETLLFVSVIC